MGAEEFKDTVLETLRYDKKYAAYKEQLLPIVSRSTFNFIPQYEFTRMPNQRWMTLEFRTPVPLINAANELEETLGDLFSYVYQEDEYYALGDINIRPLLRAGTEPPVENDVAFQDIQDTIIQGIRDAKILIWVAVAWFSNHILFEELLKKQKEGVSIRIIEYRTFGRHEKAFRSNCHSEVRLLWYEPNAR